MFSSKLLPQLVWSCARANLAYIAYPLYFSLAPSPERTSFGSLLHPSNTGGRSTRSKRAYLALLWIFAAAVPACAQDSAQNQQSQNVAPAQTEAAQSAKLSRIDVDDWVVECVDPPVNNVACQITYTVLFGAKRAPVFVSAIANSDPGEPMDVVFVLPLNIKLKQGLRISNDSRALQYQFDRCAPNGCYVETLMSADLYEMMTTSQAGFATIVRNDGEPFAIPFSFKGFSAAVDTMNLRNSAVAAAAAE